MLPIARAARRAIATLIPVPAVLMALMVVPVAADVEPLSYDLAGRWTSIRFNYVLDVGRCGEDWCGVKLNADQSCGAVAMRLRHVAKAGKIVMLTGHLDLQPEIEPYEVSITFDNANNANPSELHMAGDPDVAPSLLNRTIQFNDLLARTGDATCKVEPKTS